jgi:hypothetical protein
MIEGEGIPKRGCGDAVSELVAEPSLDRWSWLSLKRRRFGSAGLEIWENDH